MRILVTGASGFIGSNIALELDRLGHEVVVICTKGEQELGGFSGKIIWEKFYDVDWDLEIGRIDVLFHEAAITGMLSPAGKVYDDREEFMFVNCDASIKLFEEAISRGCKKIIYGSSCSVYGHSQPPFVEGKSEAPNSFYGESKFKLDRRAMELASENPEVRIVGLRYSNVFGPRENHKGKSANIIYQFAQQMREGRPRAFRDGTQRRDEIYIKDVIKANMLSLHAEKSCVVNCGRGKAVTFNEILKELNRVTGLDRETEFIDNPYGEFFQDYTECDMTLAKKMIGFEAEWDLKSALEDYDGSGWLLKDPILVQ